MSTVIGNSNYTLRLTSDVINRYHDKRVRWGWKAIKILNEGQIIRVSETVFQEAYGDVKVAYAIASLDIPMADGYGTRHVSGNLTAKGYRSDDDAFVRAIIDASEQVEVETYASVMHEVDGAANEHMAVDVINALLKSGALDVETLKQACKEVMA